MFRGSVVGVCGGAWRPYIRLSVSVLSTNCSADSLTAWQAECVLQPWSSQPHQTVRVASGSVFSSGGSGGVKLGSMRWVVRTLLLGIRLVVFRLWVVMVISVQKRAWDAWSLMLEELHTYLSSARLLAFQD